MASSPPTSPRARRSKPTAGRPTPAPPTSGTSPMSWRHGRPRRSALGPPRLLQRQDLGARRLPRTAKTASPELPPRIRLPLQPTPNPPRRLPLPLRKRPRPKAANLQHVDHAGSSGISLSAHINVSMTRDLLAVSERTESTGGFPNRLSSDSWFPPREGGGGDGAFR